METVFSVGSDPRLYKENPRPAEEKLKESFEMARKELGCEKKTSCVLCSAVTVRLV
jgi:hypothetical protein